MVSRQEYRGGAVSEALGAEVDFDANASTISINSSGDSGIPYNDDSTASAPAATTAPAATSAPTTPSTPSTSSGKTFSSAIPVGKSVSFDDPYSYDGLAYTGNYTVSVTSAKSISRSEIAALGFREPEANLD
ncbi:hypothetical protein D3C76_463420 [compost metagenome]